MMSLVDGFLSCTEPSHETQVERTVLLYHEHLWGPIIWTDVEKWRSRSLCVIWASWAAGTCLLTTGLGSQNIFLNINANGFRSLKSRFGHVSGVCVKWGCHTWICTHGWNNNMAYKQQFYLVFPHMKITFCFLVLHSLSVIHLLF